MMKNKLNQLLLLCLILNLACEKNPADTIIKDFTSSACKNNFKEFEESENIHLKIINNNQLLIEHYNAYFNCEPGRILVKGEIINGNQINIYEDEEQSIADCICRYDLNYKIDGINTGETTITFYKMGLKRLIYNINLSIQTDTVLQVTPDEPDITNLHDNPYFPLDSNDSWIYTNTVCLIDDISDSIDDSSCETKLDTITPGRIKVIGRFVTRKFGQNYFNTQSDKVLLIIDINQAFKNQYAIDLLFTELNDTSWSDTVYHELYGDCVVSFRQSRVHNDTADEITLTVDQGYFIGLKDMYVFQKDKGIIRSSFSGINLQGDTELTEYKNN